MPDSTICPPETTMMRSALTTVERRCAMPMMASAIHKMGIVEDARAAIENPRVTNLLGDARIVNQRSREWGAVVVMESATCTTIKEW